jgi:hypothetical protein
VEATDFLLRDALQVSTTLQNSKQGSYTIDATRSAMYLQRQNFPLNTEFETTVTFVNRDGKPGNYVNTVTPVPNHCGMHSFVQLPDNNFKTRLYDGRSPYITNSYFDYSTPIEPIQKIILDAIVYKRKTHLLQK